jgi:serine/threonine-protein kinase
VAWEFGHYRMESLIARGGMGEVHRAYDTQHDRVVAVKLLNAHLVDDDDFRRRFTREARAAARLREPHVIPIHAFGEIDGRLYLDMRLVEGDDVSTVLKRHGRMPPASAVDLVAQVAGALDAAHADGLVHRDVKPSNVLLDAGGFAYLVDFGIARSMAASADITGTGIPIGTVAYMAPERFEPDCRVDHRADVYSLACLLYQCLTGTPPFPDENPLALMQAHLNREPPRPTDLRPELPADLDHVIATGLAKGPGDRYPTAGALAAAARNALAQPPAQQSLAPQPPAQPPTAQLTTARPPTAQPPVRPATLPVPAAARPMARHTGRWWLVGAAVVLVAALATTAALLDLPPFGDHDRDRGPAAQPTTTRTETRTETRTGTRKPGADLSVSVPLSTPACDGSYIVIVASALEPAEYQQDIQTFLEANPGAEYLHAPSTGCGSLRRQLDGADIYSVYYGPFQDEDEACARRTTEGGDAFVRRLDNTSSPKQAVSCG